MFVYGSSSIVRLLNVHQVRLSHLLGCILALIKKIVAVL